MASEAEQNSLPERNSAELSSSASPKLAKLSLAELPPEESSLAKLRFAKLGLAKLIPQKLSLLALLSVLELGLLGSAKLCFAMLSET